MHFWILTDTHFNHLKLEQVGSRMGDWQDRLWRGISSIPWDDVFIHLGDVSLGNDEAVHRRIASCPARSRILVRGNHDTESTDWYLDTGWSFVCDGFELAYMGYRLWFSHRPQLRMGEFTHNFHGHTHGDRHRIAEYAAFYDPEYHKDVSPEIMGFRPLRLDTLVEGLGIR